MVTFRPVAIRKRRNSLTLTLSSVLDLLLLLLPTL